MAKRQLHHTPEPPKRKKGGQPGNSNAKGNAGPPLPNTLSHGLYTVGMTEEEKELYPHIQIGNVEPELRHARIMLRRACRAQLMWEQQKGILNEHIRQNVKAALGRTIAADLFNLESIELKEGVLTAEVLADGEEIPFTVATPASETKIIRKRTDFSAEIIKYTRLIVTLEETQLRLMEEGSGEDYARQLAEDIRLFGDNAMSTMPGQGLAKEEM